MSEEAAPKDPKVIVSDGNYRRPSLLSFWRSNGKRVMSFGRRGKIAILLVVIVAAVVIGYVVYKKVTNPDITIGKTVITPQAIQELSREITAYSKNTHVSFGGSSQHVAGDDLVLNAALKDQANKHHITITQADIDATNAQKYQSYGSKAAYERYVQAVGISNLTNILGQNSAYEAKLNDVVIAKKDLFVVSINYDAPYFNTSKDPAALRQQATKTLQSKFLPLFKQHESETQIAAQADLNYTLHDPAVNESAYSLLFTGMPSTAYYVQDCSTAKPCFNDAQVGRFASIPGIVSTATKVAQLTQVGQYTNVFTSKAGFIGILQLSKQTPGAYNSWDELLKDYRQQYAPKLALNTSMTGHGVGISYKDMAYLEARTIRASAP